MDIKVGDKLIMKKPHPCGENRFTVLRIGMDFKLRCDGCGHEIMAPRSKIEKRIKNIITEE
ncbi:MAG: DUF951 domain-containing protein [Clostridia bacterium]|nr:DUF951 domain-containing protein [Clostridia bacterium]MBQ4132101.1 DUF951 domain-containing protein [Clostridia bacterium]